MSAMGARWATSPSTIAADLVIDLVFFGLLILFSFFGFGFGFSFFCELSSDLASHARPNSAYMLFYERVEADETASEPAGPASHSASQGSNANANAPSMAALKPSASFRRMYSNGGNGSLQASQQGGGASAMSPSKEIAQSVWRENRQFLVESLLFDRNYTRYLIAVWPEIEFRAI